MKKFSVALEIRTKLASLGELARLMGIPISANISYSIGEEKFEGGLFSDTLAVVELESKYGELPTLMQCMQDKLELVPIHDIFGSFSDLKISLYIAAFHDNAYCSVSILPQHADFFGRRNITMDIYAYPVNKDEWNE